MSEALAPERIKEYIKDGGTRCPRCRSDQIEGGPIEVDKGWADQEMWCNDCEASWIDKYTLTSVVDRGTGEEVGK